MLRRDYILNEANKLAKLIAKLMGLKTDGNGDKFRANFDKALQDEYDLELEELTQMSEDEFAQRIKHSDYGQEKLNALSQLLYMFAEPFEPTEQTASLLRKVMIIFDELETAHHFESFENLNKRSHIYTFFKENYERL